MNRVTSPLGPGTGGPAVGDLQDGLRLLVERRVLPLAAAERDGVLAQLADERATTTYGDTTQKLVTHFQQHRTLPTTGEVDEDTAAALNDALQRLGVFDRPARPASFLVAGQVTDPDGTPVPGAAVRAEHVDGRLVVRLASGETDAVGRYTLSYAPLPDGSPVQLRVVVADADGTTRGRSQTLRDAGPVEVQNVEWRAGRRGRVEGRVTLDHGAPADGATLVLYRTGFGGAAVEVGRTTTSAAGDYAFAYDLDDRSATLELRAVTPAGDEVALTRPLTHMGAAKSDRVDVIAPAKVQPAEAEYTRLVADVDPHLGGGSLAAAREADDRRDLSALNSATGWDARLLALAGTAQRLADDRAVGLAAEPLYGLFRAGLPTDPLLLAQVEPALVRTALDRLVTTGIVALDQAKVDEFVQKHETFAVATRLTLPAPGSRSTYGALLKTAGVSQEAQDAFAPVFLRHEGDGAALWDRARAAGVDEPSVARLQWQGKLAFLAGNSEPVTRRLMNALGGAEVSPVGLVQKGLFQAAPWRDELEQAAADAGVAVDDLVPTAYAGTAEQRLDAYAEDLARKIRRSYPTQVVAELVRTDALPVPAARDVTANLLDAAAAEGFALGRTPVEPFLAGREHLVKGLTKVELAEAKRSVKSLHRISQLTASDAAMTVLANLGLTSAYDVTALRHGPFVARFTDKYRELHGAAPRAWEVELVWRKAHQVSSVVYTVMGITRKLDSDPPVPVVSGTPKQRDDERAGLKKALRDYPTLESLFGSTDYVECAHCRSVLGPAAYLVDLLQFLEDEPATWGTFQQRWKERNGTAYTDRYQFPYDALVARRPDLVHLPLTCENTNTALPYIDVVNEILEYSVAHGALAPAAAHDTGDATTEELLAEPQNVEPAAYTALRAARYPHTLPFDLWLETVREFGEYTGAPLWTVLETFRGTDALFSAAEQPDRAAVFLESLGITPGELAILTDPDPLAAWWELFGYDSAATATTEAVDADGQRVDLRNARTLSRRLGVTYQELVALVRTGFVNPRLTALGVLVKIPLDLAGLRLVNDAANRTFHRDNADLLGEERGLSDAQKARRDALAPADWERLGDLDALLARVAEHSKRYGRTVDAVLADLATLPPAGVLVLASAGAGAGFEETTLRFADGAATDDEAFLRLTIFVRLWRALGWTIEETDRALQVFIPATTPYTGAHFDKRPLLSALIHLSHLAALQRRLTGGRPGRTELLTLWSDLPVTGEKPLYARLFLRPGARGADPVFDHPAGDYLDPAWVAAQGQGKPPEFGLVKGHLPAVQGALGATADDVTAILTDAGSSLDTATLTLPTVSLLYRYRLLATALTISVPELVTIKALSGFDPFHAVHTAPLEQLAEDHPFAHTLAFVDTVENVRRSGLSVAALDFLVRRRFDETGPHRRDRTAVLTLLADLADGALAIAAQHATPTDAALVTEDALQATAGLLLAPAVAARLLRLLRGEETLDDTTRDFFDDHLRRKDVRATGDTGFLDWTDYPGLFTKVEPEKLPARRLRVAQALLPVVRDRLVRDLVIGTLVASTGGDRALVTSLLADRRLLRVGPPAGVQPLVTALAAPLGVDVDFFTSVDATGGRQRSVPVVATADTELKVQADALGPALPATGSARFAGYLRVPTDGAYRFVVRLAKKDATARLELADLPQPLVLDGKAGADDAELTTAAPGFVELKAGVPYRFTLTLTHLADGRAQLLVRGETLGTGPLSQLRLYPAAALEAALDAHEQLASTLLLVTGLGLDEREIRHVLTHPASWGGIDLTTLPARPTGDTAAEVAAARTLFGQIMGLAAYTRLRDEFPGAGAQLVEVFEAQAGVAVDRLTTTVYPLLAKLTRRTPAVVRETAETLFATPVFDGSEPVRRLWDALALTGRLGAAAPVVRGWTRIVADAASEAERVEIARAVRESVRARFDAETWLRAAQPIFDRLRQRRRDALVAHLMHRDGLVRRGQLYEHFLVDPDMEPVVQTSRIRLAIASVQQFVQRCLLNREPQVHPSAILGADRWEWMRRYRVWEANRKIFLYPENWLEPEFRDEKTHLFTELEGTLLQSDVSPDVVDGAFRTYLRGLEELARLEVVAMHIEEGDAVADNTVHVFGRTVGVPHKYFYRRYADRMWSPWTPVSAEIEGDHLVPVVWEHRLWLFWLTFVEQAESAGGGPTKADELGNLPGLKRRVEVHLHWSTLVDGEWTTGQAGSYTGREEDRLVRVVSDYFRPDQLMVGVDVVQPPDPDQDPSGSSGEAGVYVLMGSPLLSAFHLRNRNSAPRPLSEGQNPELIERISGVMWAIPNWFEIWRGDRPTRVLGSGALSVTYRRTISSGDDSGEIWTGETVLGSTGRAALLRSSNLLTLGVSPEAYVSAARPEEVQAALRASIEEIANLMRPFFVADDDRTFFVEPEVTERTVEQWEEWVTFPVPGGKPGKWIPKDDFWERGITPQFPKIEIPKPGPLPDPLVGPRPLPDPASIVQVVDRADWLANPGSGLLVGDDVVVGRTGAVARLERSPDVAGSRPGAGWVVPTTVGTPGAGVVVVDAGRGVEAMPAAGLTVVGSGGADESLILNGRVQR
jgi:peptidoglycan hydrolase-like protein with peptidoglycan-binding domain